MSYGPGGIPEIFAKVQGHFATVVVAEGVGIAADGAVESVVGIGEAFYHVAADGIDYVRDERATICVPHQTACERYAIR